MERKGGNLSLHVFFIMPTLLIIEAGVGILISSQIPFGKLK
jgi:hypothetical protein